jgi:hypothetical protein
MMTPRTTRKLEEIIAYINRSFVLCLHFLEPNLTEMSDRAFYTRPSAFEESNNSLLFLSLLIFAASSYFFRRELMSFWRRDVPYN